MGRHRKHIVGRIPGLAVLRYTSSASLQCQKPSRVLEEPFAVSRADPRRPHECVLVWIRTCCTSTTNRTMHLEPCVTKTACVARPNVCLPHSAAIRRRRFDVAEHSDLRYPTHKHGSATHSDAAPLRPPKRSSPSLEFLLPASHPERDSPCARYGEARRAVGQNGAGGRARLAVGRR